VQAILDDMAALGVPKYTGETTLFDPALANTDADQVLLKPWAEAIKRHHMGTREPPWVNSNARKWCATGGFFEVMKLFCAKMLQHKDNIKKEGANDVDFCSLTAMLQLCDVFKAAMDADEARRVEVIRGVAGARNPWAHNQQQEFTEEEAKKHLDALCTFLEREPNIKDLPEAKVALRRVRAIQARDFSLLPVQKDELIAALKLQQQVKANRALELRLQIAEGEATSAKEEATSAKEELRQMDDQVHRLEMMMDATKKLDSLPFPDEVGDSPYFTGQEGLLSALHTSLFGGDAADGGADAAGGDALRCHVLAQKQAVHGYGGIGKTETTKEYARRHRMLYPSGVFWVNAEDLESFNRSYRQIALKKLCMKSMEEKNDDAVVREAVLRWLTVNGGWLLVLDNADDPELLLREQCMPPKHAKGHVLVTSRANPDVFTAEYEQLGIKKAVSVSKLPLKEAELLLWRYAQRENGGADGGGDASGGGSVEHASSEQEVVAWLAGSKGMDGLPLALSQAGAYVRQSKCTFAVYKSIFIDRRTKAFEAADADPAKALYAWLQNVRLQQYAEKLQTEIGVRSLGEVKEVVQQDLEDVGMSRLEVRRFLRAVEAGVQVPKQTNTVASTWRINFERLSPAAQQLIGAASLFAPDDIPDLIVPALARAPALASTSAGCSGALRAVFVSAGEVMSTAEEHMRTNELLNELAAYSLVQRRSYNYESEPQEQRRVAVAIMQHQCHSPPAVSAASKAADRKRGGGSLSATELLRFTGFSMHRLVQQVQRDSMLGVGVAHADSAAGESTSSAGFEQLWCGCVRAIRETLIFDSDKPWSWAHSYGMATHGQVLLKLREEDGGSGEGFGDAAQVAHTLCKQGLNKSQYAVAGEWANRSLTDVSAGARCGGGACGHCDFAALAGRGVRWYGGVQGRPSVLRAVAGDVSAGARCGGGTCGHCDFAALAGRCLRQYGGVQGRPIVSGAGVGNLLAGARCGGGARGHCGVATLAGHCVLSHGGVQGRPSEPGAGVGDAAAGARCGGGACGHSGLAALTRRCVR
jgi:hypothetical protein